MEAVFDILREMRPRLEAELETFKDQMEFVLKPEQKQKWEKIFEHMHKRMLPPVPELSDQDE